MGAVRGTLRRTPARRGRAGRLALAAAAVLALPVRAKEPPEAAAHSAAIPTFSYQGPQPGAYRLRAALELSALQAIGLVGYVVADPEPSIPGARDPVPPWDKLLLLGRSWAFEADDIHYNYYAHPLEGALYYLVARGNRLPILESSLWTAATGLAWELIEYHEPVSVSDMVTTTFGGIAIGEALTQLAAHLERSGDGGIGEAFSWLAFPKKTHDLVDGARVERMGDPGWHEFLAFQGAGPLRQSAGSRPALQSSFGSRLFRLPGYGAPGSATTSLADAERSRLRLSMTYGSEGLVDARFRTQVALWGLYHRDIAGDDAGRLSGGDLFLGAVIGFDYQYHDGQLPAPAMPDQMILLEIPGAELEYRTFAGPFMLETQGSAALTFGGVRPLAFDRAAPLPPGVALPSVVSRQGYYHSAGFALGLDVRLRVGPAGLGAAIGYNRCWAIQELDGIPPGMKRVEISDARLETGARASYRFDGSGVEVVARWDRWVRSGVVDGTERETAETLSLLGVTLAF